MAIINTTEDLLRALGENPEWKEAVRRAILTEELINLPARFDQFVTEQRQFNDRIERFVAEQGQFNDSQRQFNERADQLFARIDRRFDTMANDLSRIKGYFARTETTRYADAIVDEMGFQKVRVLDPSELVQMTRTADTSGISRGDLRSFHIADLVIEANDDNGDVHYIAIEVSFTADHRDTDRAVRNARLLTRFTGYPAHAAIGSVRNDREIQDVIDSRQVYWYELDERDPEPE